MAKTMFGKGQKKVVKKGPYKGQQALLRNRGARVSDEKGDRIPWFCWVGDWPKELTIVYEDEL